MKEYKFKLKSDFKPAGGQPQAIEKLCEGVLRGYKHQTLLGVTGSGKTLSLIHIYKKHPQSAFDKLK